MTPHKVYSTPRLNISLDVTLLALADPTRRAILERVSDGEVRVTEIAQPFEMSLNAVSKHIRMLERAGLVERRKAGREHFLRINPKPMIEAAGWIQRQSEVWSGRLQRLDDLLKEEDAHGHSS